LGVVILDADRQKRNALSWKDWGYIICSSMIILNGVFCLLISFGIIPTMEVSKLDGGTFFGVLGTVQIGMGAALLAQLDWAQFVMKWICILGILACLRTILLAGMMSSNSTSSGMIIGISLVMMAVLGATLYFLLDMADV